jgi:hypothetical protein
MWYSVLEGLGFFVETISPTVNNFKARDLQLADINIEV